MADLTTDVNQNRAMRIAQRRVEGFAKQFGEAHRNLARHAAFPLVLTPDLLYQIWANFVPEVPWVAVAHMLLSRLCRQVGYEMYEMDITDRNLLLRELKEEFGQERFDELGEFLLDYVAQRLTDDDADTRDLREAQEWTALAYTKPSDAARKLAQRLNERAKRKETGEVLRLASLIEILAEPLVESGFEPLLVYSRAMDSSFRSDIGSNRLNWNQQLNIAGIAVNIPHKLSRKTPFVLPQLSISTSISRDRELKKLQELLLNPQRTKFSNVAVLSGFGGVGKSDLACHFATLHREDFPDGVIGLRVDSKDVNTIVRDLARHCGEEVDLEDERDAATIMQDIFAHRKMLLIFDNADDASIRDLCVGGNNCAIIITTRDRQLPGLLDIPITATIDVRPLPKEDSLELLKNILGEQRVKDEIEAAEKIIRLVGRLPLALQIVGAALRGKPRKLADYAAALEKEENLLKRLQIRGNEELSAKTSFNLSLQQLEENEKDFFACLSVCAESGFSRRTAAIVGNFDDDEWEAQDYLDRLYQLSLLNYSEVGENRFVFHPLIRLFAQELAIERGLKDDAAARHAQFFIEFIKLIDLNNASNALEFSKETDNIFVAVGWLQQQGKLKEAADVLQRQIEISQSIDDKHLIAIALNRLAGVLQQQGKLEEAANTFQRQVEIAQSIDDKRSIAIAFNGLAGILQQQGKLEEAANIFQRQVEIAQSIDDKRSIAIAFNGLAGILQQQGKLEEAANIFQRQVEIAQSIDDKHLIAIALNRLAGVLQQQGKLEEAANIFQRQVEISQSLNDIPSIAVALNGLSGVLQEQGRLKEAEDVLYRSQSIFENLDEKRSLAMVLNSLGVLFQRQQRWKEAEMVLRRSFDLSEKIQDEMGQAIILNSLARVLQQQGDEKKFQVAIAAFKQSIKIGEKFNDQEHLAKVYTAMGQALFKQQNFAEAATAFRKGFEIDEQLQNIRGLKIVTEKLTKALLKLGKRKEAINYCQRALAIAPQQTSLLQLHKNLSSSENAN